MALDKETLDLLLASVRRFVSERLVPHEAELAANNQVPPRLVDEMRALGLFGLSIAEEYGGLALTMEEEVQVAFELGQTSPAFRSIAGTNIGIGSQAIVFAGTAEQKQTLSAEARVGGDHRFVCVDRTRRRFGCAVAADVGPPRWQRLHIERHQALHHQCADRWPVHGDGPDRTRTQRGFDFMFSGRGWHAGHHAGCT